MPEVTFVPFELPEFRLPEAVPEVPKRLYRDRFEALEAARKAAGLDCLIVYADREHYANMAWLTGFDPRFEEALWIQGSAADPVLLAGNESFDYAGMVLGLDADVRLCQSLSLPDQDRSSSPPLPEALAAAGLSSGMRCGIVGWRQKPDPDIPYWMVRAVNEITGLQAENVTRLLIDTSSGIRLPIEPEAVPFYEYSAGVTSNAIKDWAFSLREGITEREAATAFESYGMELSCHPMVNFAPSIASGLKAARNARAAEGDYAQAAFGVRGGLTCRAGRLATSETPDADSYLDLVRNYLEVFHAWHSALRVGAMGGAVFAASQAALDGSWEFSLGTGHLLHLDEWAASPFRPGDPTPLRAGLAIQQAIIPKAPHTRAVVNMEDGVLLADEAFRARLREVDSEMMDRMEARQELMRELGYDVQDDVLPLSNIAGVFFPYLLEPGVVAKFA